VPHGYRGSRRGIARRARPASRLSDARRTRYGQDHPGAALPAGGNRAGERALLITLESNEAQLRSDAAAQGIDLEGVHVLDLSPTREFFAENQSYDIFSPADVERDPTTRQIIETVQEHRPERVFVDAITTLRYLSPDAFQFRKQALSFLRFLVESGATVVMSSEPTIGRWGCSS
jgi:circadian clock protein KaiC